MGHCTAEILGAYYAGTLEAAVLVAVMAHLAGCPECLARAERIGDGLILIDSWAMETRQEAGRAGRLEEALSRAESSVVPASHKQRIRHWRDRVAEGGMSSRRHPGQWRYALEAAQRPAHFRREPGALRTRSTGSGPLPLQWELGDPSRIAVSKVQPVWIGVEQAQTSGLVALVPESGGQTLLAETVESGVGQPRWVARFDSVAPGTYSVFFE
jgi:hypothetical protein